ncbi:DUF6355 family natural product biosynthesis protein [Streptomyces sp. NPDC059786]|uniref:DUF6355 family natural product biosynthesis protein n=1 Tax=Streptomyces sp. NPDC059786 TaxID=3346946 RepID=UPI003647744F
MSATEHSRLAPYLGSRENRQSRPGRRTRRSRLAGGLAALALTGAMAAAVTAPASAAPERAAVAIAPAGPQACGWNEGHGEHAYYEHCATDTNVWIQVTRWARPDYHRCVGPGRTNLDYDATGAWYDSNFRGGLCSHPGDTA